MSPKSLYQKRLDDGVLKPDSMQAEVIDVLESLHAALLVYNPKKGWFSKKDELPKGVYMHGGVGSGKSMLMDLFYECLPEDITKRRVHFHEFMIGVHDYIHSRREQQGAREGVDGTLPLLSERIAEQSRVLCFDEFHVTDIADAMILGRLFCGLYDRGVVIVSTSNWEPDDLYKDGLQRDRFLPFIAMIKDKMHVLHLDSPTDYRTQFLTQEGSYFSPLGAEASRKADHVFEALTDGVPTYEDVLEVKGREIVVERTAKGVARFTFAQLCERPHGAEDYLALTRNYHTLFIEHIPTLGYDRNNETKRLMTLIDALYEAGTNVVVTAETLPQKLYRGSEYEYEFERTVSRLLEMQSKAYIEKAD